MIEGVEVLASFGAGETALVRGNHCSDCMVGSIEEVSLYGIFRRLLPGH